MKTFRMVFFVRVFLFVWQMSWESWNQRKHGCTMTCAAPFFWLIYTVNQLYSAVLSISQVSRFKI